MKAHEIMIREVYKVRETDSVRSVILQFIQHRISGMPIVNEKEEIVGYISDGDIMRYIGKHKDIVIDSIFYVNVIKGDDFNFEDRAKKILDQNVMLLAKKPIKVAWDEEVEDIAATLGKKQFKKLPVEKNGVLVGIISRGDVIRNTFRSLL
ncbi:CBS domain-containing protein [Ammoniphilus resinae]|uniref:CBS domain-containing protein n=1 Tax=Ammoniphilus resinae TaxID=861532 RepID=A0ABS4GWI0_9BACL|nr:CBS domain-containing protein [Ammoniphilus resinae]MBP1934387.1 CBS domain-containing protein [Ammoniphilus resinae]